MTDGINNQGSFQSTYTVAPIIDQIAEFKVNSHNDQAEVGGVVGGVINVVTKSGTNQLHGSVFEYLRNNEFGVAAGGPVMVPKLYDGRNKTFFYGAFEGIRFTQAANNYLHLPTDAELAGDLTGEAQAFNPFTTRPDPAHPGSCIEFRAEAFNMPNGDFQQSVKRHQPRQLWGRYQYAKSIAHHTVRGEDHILKARARSPLPAADYDRPATRRR